MTVVSSNPDWAGRIRQLQAALPALGIEGLVVSTPINISYLTGFTGTAGLVLVTGHAAVLVTDGRYDLLVRQAIEAGEVLAIDVACVKKRYDLTIGEVIRQHGVSRVGFEAGHVTVATHGAWMRATQGAEWVPTERIVEKMRAVKDAFELSALRRGGALITEVAGSLRSFVREGRSERQVAAGIEAALVASGFSRPAFPTIVASGPNSALPHARPTDRKLASGDLVVLDFGGVLDGYCVDLSRMAAVGQVSDDALDLFGAVLAAHKAAVEIVAPGIQASEIDRAAREVLEQRGLREAFLHSTGHGLGLEVHEAPRIGRADPEAPEAIEAGMVFTVEPGAYLEATGGVRIEDDVLVTSTGYELLTTAPRELLVV